MNPSLDERVKSDRMKLNRMKGGLTYLSARCPQNGEHKAYGIGNVRNTTPTKLGERLNLMKEKLHK